jgi:hypothetical protein
MKRKERYLVRPDEVLVTRQDETALIQYKEAGVPATHLTLGPKIATLTDVQIVELYNDTLRAQAALAAGYKHVAVEVPLGSPQMRYFKPGDQWVPRGSVLRCEIHDDEDGQLGRRHRRTRTVIGRFRPSVGRSRRLGHAHRVRT